MQTAGRLSRIAAWTTFDENADEPVPEATQLPEDLSTLSDEEVGTLRDQIAEQFDAVLDAGDLSDAAVAALNGMTQQIEALDVEAEARINRATEAQAEIEALRARVHGDEAGNESGEGEGGDAGAETAEAETPSPEAVAEAANEEERELVTAGGHAAPPARVPLAGVRRAQARPANPEAVRVGRDAGRLAIVAAAGVPNFEAGARLDDHVGVGQALYERARTLPDHSEFMRAVSIDLGIPEDHHVTANMSDNDVAELMERVSDPSDVGGGVALTAAGGWCAVNQPLYQFFSIDAAEGLVDVPTVQVARGGVTWPTSPTFADVTSAMFTWTEANDISALGGSPTKPCFRIPCPSWNTARLGAYGLCLTHGNLTDRAFPELGRRYIDLLGNAHAHQVSGAIIGQIAAGSTAVTILGQGASNAATGAIAPILNSIDLQGVDYRTKYRMPVNAVLEVILPVWALPLMRADVAWRFGADADDFATTDALLQSYFSIRNVRVQLVQDWQTAGGWNAAGSAVQTTGIGDPVAANAALHYPAAINFLIFAAGTWVKGTGGTLDLGVVRDSTLNTTNDFTAAWSEEFVFVAKMGHGSRNVAVPICANGVTGAQVALTCS